MIMITNFIMLVGYAFTIEAELWAVFAGRIILGFGVGGYCVYCIKFVSELTPIEYRGPIGAIAELSIATGRWFPAIGGLFIDQNNPKKSLFIPRLLWGFPVLMLILQFILMIFVFPYDSPTELKARGETDKLKELMGKIYHKS